MKKIEVIDVVMIILTAIVFILILQKLLGNSPTEVQVMFGLASILFTFLIKVYSAHSKLNREFGELKIDLQHKFEGVEKSLDDIKITQTRLLNEARENHRL